MTQPTVSKHWWEVVAAHHRVHDYACCHLQADYIESGISSGPLRSITSMGTLYLVLLKLLAYLLYDCQSYRPVSVDEILLKLHLEKSAVERVSKTEFFVGV